eukprot:11244881-Alexandrium_andersonii.AAC.1
MKRHPEHHEEQTGQTGVRQTQPHRERTAHRPCGRRRQTGPGKRPQHDAPRPGLEKSHREQHRH